MGENLIAKLAGKRIGLDVLGGEIAYISHAHSDHCEAVGGPLPIFCTDETATMLSLNMNGNRCGNGENEGQANVAQNGDAAQNANGAALDALGASLKPSDHNALGALALAAEEAAKPKKGRRKKSKQSERVGIPEGIKLHNAGHMLGASQIEAMSENEGNVVYTGDFKLRAGLTVRAAPIINCDTLIAECTYGMPGLVFPKQENVLSDMEAWARKNHNSIQIWGGYSTGKAQELVKFLNDYMGIEPVVYGRAAQVCESYRKHGVNLRWVDAQTHEAQEIMRSPFCAVMPPHHISPEFTWRLSSIHRRKTLSAIATGWALLRRINADAAFALSDHADFGEILEYALACGAKKVYMAHGDNEGTAKALRSHGVDAQAIEKREAHQTRLDGLQQREMK